MKKYTILFLIMLFLQNCTPTKEVSSTNESDKKPATNAYTFNVCKVEKATKLLPALPYRDVIVDKTVTVRNKKERETAINQDKKLDWQKKHELLQDKSYQPEGVPVRVIEATAKEEVMLVKSNFHPFMNTLHTAYAKHYPMTISPDMIWLLIAQGFANHVNENGEEMRQYFVDFEGKKTLHVKRDEFRKGSEKNDWPGAFAEFSVLIEENTGTDLLELVTGDFSTTGAVEKAAFQVTLMDAMKSYFIYAMTTACGIPEITLEGTVEDWKAIEYKAQEIAKYDLEWWIDDLMPVLKEFTKAAEGKPDKKFWESIYKWTNPGSGSPYITGWILKFFPYKDVNGKLVVVKALKEETGGKNTYNLQATTGQFTSGLSAADMTWNYFGTFYSMELVAGFVGFRQDAETFALRPEISWAVIDKQTTPSQENIDAYWEGGDKKYKDWEGKQ